MDYEQKYREVLKKAEAFYYSATTEPITEREVLANIFPELKESEDDMIRKALIDFFNKGAKNGEQTNGVYDKDILDWLEKQGEQKDVEPTPIFRVGDTLKKKGKDYTFIVDRILGGYYHCDRNNGAFFPIEEQGNWELVEQKPAWSEEDKKYLRRAINATRNGYPETNNWLKSLKERYAWKPSDEQMIALQEAMNIVGILTITGSKINSLYQDLKKLKEE